MTLTQRHKIFAALLLWSSLFSIGHLLAADLPVVRASYNAIGGVFRRFGSRKKINCSTNTVFPSI